MPYRDIKQNKKLYCMTQKVNNGVVYLDYEDSHNHGPLLCSFQ